ncbi:MAG: response regulator transcription factor [Geodermatophilaceae bacterium]|nr:response regulator transcription factor [Geodermatophilaceae bacterium]MDQ3463430.1 response regulator transcription factor [Actinomycetota bacterium]
MSVRPVRILLVDDHEMVRQGLKAMLARYRDDVVIVGEAGNAEDAERLVAALGPEIVLCDVRLGNASGLDLAKSLLQRDAGCKIVILTVYDDEQYLYQALRVGVSGYLLKRVDGAELVGHLLLAADGHIVIDPMLAGRAATSAARLQAGEFWPGARLGLSQRESEVLALAVSGMTNRAIAARLVIGDETVKSHISSLYRKLEVRDRAGAVAVAMREGLFR